MALLVARRLPPREPVVADAEEARPAMGAKIEAASA
jgi:hypothetical protein